MVTGLARSCGLPGMKKALFWSKYLVSKGVLSAQVDNIVTIRGIFKEMLHNFIF